MPDKQMTQNPSVETEEGKVEIARPIRGRNFRSCLATEALDRIQRGVMKTVYREVPFLKSPFDISLYLQLLSRLAPRTVFEIGGKYGGSALWFADMLTAQCIADPVVISIDIKHLSKFSDPRIQFLAGDAKDLGSVLLPELLKDCPHPWLVVEDSSHYYVEAKATLDFFHVYLQAGDYIVVEDGIVSQLGPEQYRQYKDGPNRAVADFLTSHAGEYEIDADLCDRFGHNLTYNPNGWLRRL